MIPLFSFTVAEFEDVDGWIRFILNKRETVFSLLWEEEEDRITPIELESVTAQDDGPDDDDAKKPVSIVKKDSSKRKVRFHNPNFMQQLPVGRKGICIAIVTLGPN